MSLLDKMILEFLHHAHKFQTDYISKQETHKNSRRKLRKIAQSLKAYFLSTMYWISAGVEAQLGPQSVALRCHGLHTQMCRLSAVFGCPGKCLNASLVGPRLRNGGEECGVTGWTMYVF